MENYYPQKKILYVDDDLQSRLLVKHLIGKSYNLTICSTAEEALRILQIYRFNLILLDIRLEGEMTGVELLSVIRNMSEHKNTPAVAVTAFAFEDDKEYILSSGFEDYMAKPISLNHFKEMVKSYVENQETITC
jgi:CheY-like chemotaxis protein